MIKSKYGDIAYELIETFRERENQTVEEIARANWRSITCLNCGSCCCSDVIPISKDDFDGFHKRLDIDIDRKDFAKKFLQNPDTGAAEYAIEAKRYGGKCMFLDKDENSFSCGRWDVRPNVCREFFCYEMANFEKYMDNEEQDLFNPTALWKDNFALLIIKVINESPLSAFPDEMIGWLKLRACGPSSGYYKSHPEEFMKKEK